MSFSRLAFLAIPVALAARPLAAPTPYLIDRAHSEINFIADSRQASGWNALIESLDPLEKALLIIIAKRMPPMAQATLKQLGRGTGAPPTVAKVRAAITRLRKAGIVSIEGRADVQIEDRLLAEYLAAL